MVHRDKIYILAIGGSPRKGGASDNLLESACDGARREGAKVEKIILNDLVFKPCQECGGCDLTGICVLKDDMSAVYAKLESADGIIVSSPIFFGTVSAQLKAMIDRTQCIWASKYLLNKPSRRDLHRKGIFLCTGGRKARGHFENAKVIVRIFFKVLDIDYMDDMFIGGIEKGSDLKGNPAALNKAFELGRALVRDLSVVHARHRS